MSDFFEDELVEENSEKSEESTEEEKKIKHKKLWPKIVAAVLCLCVLVGGTIIIEKVIPKKDKNKVTSNPFSEFEALKVDENDVSFINIKNENGEYKLYSEKDTSAQSDANALKWYVDGIDKLKTNTYTVSEIVDSATNIKAIRKITEKSAADCGLSETESDVIVKITKSDNSEISVLFGQMSPDNTGMYLKTSSSDDIYLVSSTLKDTFVFDKLKFADVSMLPKPEMGGGYDSYFENGNLLKFDSLSLIGKNYENPLVIVPNTEAAISDYIPYKIISPDEHYADKVDELLALFSGGVSVSGIYSYDVTEAEMTNFGFKTPDLTVKLTLGNKEFIYIFKAQEDGDYAAAATDGIYIYKVSAATVSALAGSKPTDYYSSIISLFSIDDLSEINITAEGKTYKFGIKANSDENAEDRYIITHDGKSIDCSSFQNFYQYFLMISCYDYNIGETNKDDYINVEFGFNNGSTAAVRFERADDTNYQYSFNSKPVGKVPMYKLTKLIKYLKKLSNGEKLGTLT